MAMSPVGLRTKHHCAGENRQQFGSQWVLGYMVSSHYLANTSDQTEDFMWTVVVVICTVCAVFASYKHSINTIINPNIMSSHQHMTI